MPRLLHALVKAALVTAGIATLLNWVAPDWWLSDLLVHFRIQYLVISIIAAIALPLLGSPTLALAGLLAGAFNIVPVIDYFSASSTAPTANNNSHVQFRIAGANVFFRNRDYKAIANWIAAEQADVVVLVEATEPLQRELLTRLTDYPFHNVTIKPGHSGKLILSRRPLAITQIIEHSSGRSSTPMMALALDGISVNIAGVHTSWPVRPQSGEQRNRELLDLANAARQQQSPTLLIGDFNISPFSRHYQRMLTLGGLTSAAAGRGWLATWPTFFWPAGIQIDHLLISRQIRVRTLRTGRGIGSDHRWIVADLLITR